MSNLCSVQVAYEGQFIYIYTVNVVIFAGGKFRENVGKTFHVGVLFMLLLLHKGTWVLFPRWGNFREKDKSAKPRNLPLC